MTDRFDRTPPTKPFHERRAEATFARAVGMDEAGRKRMAEANAGYTDWHAKCRVCGEELTGSMAEIAKHQHG